MGNACTGSNKQLQKQNKKTKNSESNNKQKDVKSLNRYKFLQTLGSGAYGKVFLAKDEKTNEKVAIKKVFLGQNLEMWKRMLREVKLMRQINCNYITKLNDFMIDGEENDLILFLVQNFGGQDLSKVFKSQTYYDELQIKKISYQIVLAMKYLNDAKILHRDIKPSNFLINNKQDVKLIDFGLAKCTTLTDFDFATPVFCQSPEIHNVKQKIQKSRTLIMEDELSSASSTQSRARRNSLNVVSRSYRAPEVISHQDYNNKIDVWAVGCVLAELQQMLQENTCQDERGPIFFASQDQLVEGQNNKGLSKSAKKQLEQIFEIIGKQSEENLTFIEDLDILKEVQQINNKTKVNGFQLSYNLPYSSEDVMDLLNKMLQFNPNNRFSFYDVLNHPYFTEIRDKSKEKFQLPQRNFSLMVDELPLEDLSFQTLKEFFIHEKNQFEKAHSQLQQNMKFVVNKVI